MTSGKPQHIHLIACCGTGMGSLAGMLKARGYHVTGSDQHVYPPMSTQLEAWGIPLYTGFRAEHLQPRPDLVVVGNAVIPPESRSHGGASRGYSGLVVAAGAGALFHPASAMPWWSRARMAKVRPRR